MKRNDEFRAKLKTLKVTKSATNLITISNKFRKPESTVNLINMPLPIPSRVQSGEIKLTIAPDRR